MPLVWPGAAMGLTILASSLLGNAVRDALDTTERPAVNKRRRRLARISAPAADYPADRLLTVAGLRVGYPKPGGEKTVVDGVDLTVARGEVLGLVGESGSGKSRTAFCVLGLLPDDAEATADRLTFDGQDLLGMDTAALNRLRGHGIGYVPQEPMSNLDPCFRIGFQLVEPMRTHLGLSRAAALDVTVQAEVLDLMRSLQQEHEMGMILVTHDFGVVADICDRVAVMRGWRIVETAPMRQIFAAPEHPYTRTLLDSTLDGGPVRGGLCAHSGADEPLKGATS